MNVSKFKSVLLVFAGLGCIAFGVWPRGCTQTPDLSQTSAPSLLMTARGIQGAQLSAPSVDMEDFLFGDSKGKIWVWNADKEDFEGFQSASDAFEVPPLRKNGTFFIGDKEGIFGLYRFSDSPLWVFHSGAEVKAPGVQANGLFLGVSYDNTLYAFEPETGKVRFQVETQSFLNAPPAVDPRGGRLYLGGCDGVIRAVSLTDGKELWTFETRSHLPGGAVWDESRQKVYAAAHDGTLYALNPAGTLAWRSSAETDSREKVNFLGAPCFFEQGLFAADEIGNIFKFDPENGKLLARIRHTSKCFPGFVFKGTLYLSDADGALLFLNPETLEIRGKQMAAPSFSSPPVRTRTRIGITGDDGLFYSGVLP